MNTASQPEGSTLSQILSSAEGSRPPQLPSAEAACSRLFSRLSPVDPRLLSNRHIPELESPVSHRKQRIGPLSNRHKIAFCNFHPLTTLNESSVSLPLAFQSRLSTLDHRLPSLIANDMHSREESSPCKQTTCNFLIANEIHSRNTLFSLRFSLPQRAQLARNVHCMAHGMVYVMAARRACPPQAGVHAQFSKSGGEERSE